MENVSARPMSFAAPGRPMTRAERRVVFASSLGTVFEWYDFFLYGSLAVIIGRQFFAALDPTSQTLFALLAFGAGFIVRPFGALVFGRLGDTVGRKTTLLVTILIMGLSTCLIGLLPGYATLGVIAPAVLIGLRMLQGLALGGEYGVAATYVAEHAPAGQRGFFTAWIQTTATLGLFLSLIVILATRTAVGEAEFADWGWRIPFLGSVVSLAIGVWIRTTLNESPAFRRMRDEGRTSKAPLAESFGQRTNMRLVVIALVGLTMGQAVVWYTGQFYALFFLTGPLKVDGATANILVAMALLIGTPFFIVFGALSDRIGRKPIILAGCLIAALTTFPLFRALTEAANPDLARAQASAKVTLIADPRECSFLFNPTGAARFTSSCDIAKQVLAAQAVSYDTLEGSGPARIAIGDKLIEAHSTQGLGSDEAKARDAALKGAVGTTLREHGYPIRADGSKMNRARIVGILTLLVILAAMVYGPIAAMLVEMFPTRIRTTSMSLPYHIGNGWFGGLLPATALAIVAQTGNMYDGLWYPVAFATLTFVIGLLFVRETKDVDIGAHDHPFNPHQGHRP